MRKLSILAVAAFVGAAVQAQSTRDFSSSHRTSSNYSSSSSLQDEVKKYNKASSLIGAEVRTRDAEKVGKVKDVVIDFDSGRVGYIVLEADEILEGNEKHVAVPARAFRVVPDQDHVVLEADKDRLQSLRTFAENDYPAMRTTGSQMDRFQSSGSARQFGQARSQWHQPSQWQDRSQSRDQWRDQDQWRSQMGQDRDQWQTRRDFQDRNQWQSRGDWEDRGQWQTRRDSQDRSQWQSGGEWLDRTPDRARQWQDRNDFQSRSSQGSGEDPDLYLYEWHVFEIPSESQQQQQYSSRRDSYQDRNPYGGYGSSQQGSGRYSNDRSSTDSYSTGQDWQSRNRSGRQGQQSRMNYDSGRYDSQQRQSGRDYGQQDYSQRFGQQRQYDRFDSGSGSDRYDSGRFGSSQNWHQGELGDYSSQQNQFDTWNDNWEDRTSQGAGAHSQSGRYGQSSSGSQSSDDGSFSSSQADTRTFNGRIKEIDRQNRTLTVEGSNRTMNFKLSSTATVKMSGRQNASLSDLQENEWVQIGYRYEDGSNQAFTINQTQQRSSGQ